MVSPNPVEPLMTPVNNQRDLNFPGALVRQHWTDVQRHPSTLLPPSASNFLDQNNYPSLHSPHVITNDNQHPHTFSSHTFPSHSHFPQPQFYHQPQPQFYPPSFHHVQPSYNQHPYFLQRHNQYYYPPPPTFISHNNNTVPLHTQPLHTHSNNINTAPLHIVSPSVHSTAPKALPSVSHIPVLSGRSDFNAWNNGVRSLVHYLGFTGHISSQPIPGVVPRPDHIPSYPPRLLTTPSADELAVSRAWWEDDNILLTS